MRVAYDHQIFCLQEYGGISRYFVELAGNIARTPGTEVSIISPLFINGYLGAATAANLRITGRRAPAIRYVGRILRAANELLAPYMMSRFRPDLVHETYYAERCVAPHRSKVVLTVYDMIHERFPECFRSRDKTTRAKAIAVGRSDHVICISEQTRRDLIEILGVPPAKTTVVHLGFSLTKPAMEERPTGGRPYLLYVGNRAGYKNFSGLLHAYAVNSSLQREYDLVAFGGGPLTPQEKALIVQLDIHAARVQQLGGDDAVLARLYRQAALFVYPSLYEGFGIPPLEAMSFGCPVVCSNASSIPEVVGDAALLFDPASPDALGVAMEQVLNNGELRRTLIERGRERIRQFSWERCAEQTLAVYRRVLS